MFLSFRVRPIVHKSAARRFFLGYLRFFHLSRWQRRRMIFDGLLGFEPRADWLKLLKSLMTVQFFGLRVSHLGQPDFFFSDSFKLRNLKMLKNI